VQINEDGVKNAAEYVRVFSSKSCHSDVSTRSPHYTSQDILKDVCRVLYTTDMADSSVAYLSSGTLCPLGAPHESMS
jgi:hypothetical protein